MSNTEIVIPEKVSRIGIFADVHARDDRLFDLLNQNPAIKHWFCAGDAIDMFSPKWDNAPSLRLMVKNNVKSIIGNHEAYIKVNKEKLMMFKGEQESIKYLMDMPFSMDVFFSGSKLKFFHATPNGVTDYIDANASDEEYDKMFGKYECDIIVLGHFHQYFDRIVNAKRIVSPGALNSAEPTFIIFEKDASIYLKKIKLD